MLDVFWFDIYKKKKKHHKCIKLKHHIYLLPISFLVSSHDIRRGNDKCFDMHLFLNHFLNVYRVILEKMHLAPQSLWQKHTVSPTSVAMGSERFLTGALDSSWHPAVFPINILSQISTHGLEGISSICYGWIPILLFIRIWMRNIQNTDPDLFEWVSSGRKGRLS